MGKDKDDGELQTERVIIPMSPDILDVIEKYRIKTYKPGTKMISRSEAIRQMIMYCATALGVKK